MAAPIQKFNPGSDSIRGVIRWTFKTMVSWVIYPAVLFLSAGRTDWPQGWLAIAVMIAIQVIVAISLVRKDPAMLVERSKVQPGTKKWDPPLVFGMALVGPLAMFATAGLDFRFGWSQLPSPMLQVLGLALLTGGSLFTLWAMLSNPFFSGTVRIQSERGHRPVSSGPYRLLRHPGYAGSLLFDLGLPLAFGSLWAFLPALLTVMVTFVRTALEDRTLREELPGYAAYATRTRYRLIPGLW